MWHEAMPLEVRATFFDLAGGWHYDRLEDAIWLGVALDRERERVRHVERWSDPLHRVWRRTYRQGGRERARKTVVATRWCRICAKPYELTLFNRAEGRAGACSPACRRLATGRWPLFRIGREQNTLTGWAKRYGMDPATVKLRVRKGWPLRVALATPPTPAAERRRQS